MWLRDGPLARQYLAQAQSVDSGAIPLVKAITRAPTRLAVRNRGVPSDDADGQIAAFSSATGKSPAMPSRDLAQRQ
jgi:hypothetical protein